MTGGQTVGVGLLALGIFSVVRGLQIRFAKVPYFVVGYRGWSSTSLSLPFGGVFVFGLGIQSFDARLPLWVLETNVVIAFPAFLVFALGMIVWFPWFLLPGWYRRARKAGIPREDPYAMARFKRLSRAEQREVAWADLSRTLTHTSPSNLPESLSVPRSPVGGAAVGLVVGLGVGAAIPVEVEGKSLGDHVADAGERFWTGGKDLWKKVFG